MEKANTGRYELGCHVEPVEHRFNRSQNQKACSGRSQAEPESLPNTVSDFPMPACAEELRNRRTHRNQESYAEHDHREPDTRADGHGGESLRAQTPGHDSIHKTDRNLGDLRRDELGRQARQRAI